jgi:hypothetical protein
MTNEDKQYEIEKDEKQKIECDWLLQRLVQNNNTQEYSTQITLYVGGKLISGEMISYRQYFEKAQGETIEPGPGKNSEQPAKLSLLTKSPYQPHLTKTTRRPSLGHLIH